MKKALIVTSVASMIKQFNLLNIQLLQKLGYEVTVATNFEDSGTIPIYESEKLYNNLITKNVIPINIGFDRNPVSSKNLDAYRELKELMRSNTYRLVHCQSPIGGFLTRLIVKKERKIESKVIYTAHGFHFYKGAPLKNWLLFYPVEKYLSKYTDVLITINSEDYKRAKGFHNKKTEYVPGVGIEHEKFSNTYVDRDKKLKELKIPKNKFIITSVGELNDNKNHQVIIKALSKLNNDNIHYIICGDGRNKGYLKRLIEKESLEEKIHLLGYRSDIPEILNISDAFAFPSKREGLGLAAVEAMACGTPLITSNIHGIKDYSINGVTGYNYAPNDVKGYAIGISKIFNLTNSDKQTISLNNKKIAQQYDISIVNKIMENIYKNL